MTNRLLCDHSFDYSVQLMSAPPQVKCKKCGTNVTVEDAVEYDASKRSVENAHEFLRLERREFWKSSALAFLTTGQVTNNSPGLSSSAVGVADAMLEHFDKRFGLYSK